MCKCGALCGANVRQPGAGSVMQIFVNVQRTKRARANDAQYRVSLFMAILVFIIHIRYLFKLSTITLTNIAIYRTIV